MIDKDTIIRLAREAGILEMLSGEPWQDFAERFAALVATHEREHICKQIAMLHDSLSLTGTANWGRTQRT